jgi:hypothetical protein
MAERLLLNRRMREAGATLPRGAADFSPPLELVGVYITHCSVTKMVAEGRLDNAAGAYLNAALSCHAFTILHHCTHESISQHEGEHEAFENTVFRLACALLYHFDDSYKVAHRNHHQRVNQDNDPDVLMSHTSLPVLGDLIHSLTRQPQTYVFLGAPLGLTAATVMSKLGVSGWLMRSWIAKNHIIDWNHMTNKMAVVEAQQVLGKHGDYAELYDAMQSTWRGSSAVGTMLLSLFFGAFSVCVCPCARVCVCVVDSRGRKIAPIPPFPPQSFPS